MAIIDSPFDRINKVPAYRVLAELMTERILDGRLKEGDQLPTEAQLCEAFGVNRSTVREGIRVLEEANLLRRESAKKMIVTRPSHDEISGQVERMLVLHQISFSELCDAMLVLEPAVAKLAAGLYDGELLSKLEQNVVLTAAAVKAGDSVVSLDIEFHRIVAAMSTNRALILAREPMSRLFYPAFSAVMTNVPVAGKRLLDAHRAVLGAIKAKDAAGAEEWMRKHIKDFHRGYHATRLDNEAASTAPSLQTRPAKRMKTAKA
ncbi:FCD domain-containing protein [uncultured Caballeronia sp.]|uniref:FadR/GntR family transcriptional regulator n=1 Tax=uncultured Caballeronia sp. TaxID=1827198 RepID=UPI001575D1F7